MSTRRVRNETERIVHDYLPQYHGWDPVGQGVDACDEAQHVARTVVELGFAPALIQQLAWLDIVEPRVVDNRHLLCNVARAVHHEQLAGRRVA